MNRRTRCRSRNLFPLVGRGTRVSRSSVGRSVGRRETRSGCRRHFPWLKGCLSVLRARPTPRSPPPPLSKGAERGSRVTVGEEMQ